MCTRANSLASSTPSHTDREQARSGCHAGFSQPWKHLTRTGLTAGPVCGMPTHLLAGEGSAPGVDSHQLLEQLEQLDDAPVQHGTQQRARPARLALHCHQVLHRLQRGRPDLRAAGSGH